MDSTIEKPVRPCRAPARRAWRKLAASGFVLAAVLFGPRYAAEPPGPRVRNGSFELDRFTRRPGYAAANGGITGCRIKGNVGINPCHLSKRGKRRSYDFADNGVIPDGEQVAFLQNIGELRQTIAGFRAGRRYRVVYYENGRVMRATPKDPVVEVLLGGEVVVSRHSVPPVETVKFHTVPYFRVESAVFIPKRDGAYELVFRTSQGGGTSLLLDNVRIEFLGPVRP